MKNFHETSPDIPPRREITKQINRLYDRFGRVIVNASDPNFDFASQIGISRVIDDDTPVDSADFTAFINHYVGGQVTGIAGSYASQLLYRRENIDESRTLELEAKMRRAQQRGERIVHQWREADAYHPMSPMESEDLTLLNTSFYAFDWSQKMDAFFDIRRIVSELGNEFSMLNHGQRLLGH